MTPFDGPVIELITPMPLALAAALMEGVSTSAREAGFEAYFREADGLTRIYCRELPPDDEEPAEPDAG